MRQTSHISDDSLWHCQQLRVCSRRLLAGRRRHRRRRLTWHETPWYIWANVSFHTAANRRLIAWILKYASLSKLCVHALIRSVNSFLFVSINLNATSDTLRVCSTCNFACVVSCVRFALWSLYWWLYRKFSTEWASEKVFLIQSTFDEDIINNGSGCVYETRCRLSYCVVV